MIPKEIDGVEVIEADSINAFETLIERSKKPTEEFNIAVNIDSVHKYVKYVEFQNSKTDDENNHLIFRGHSDINYSLMPSIMRSNIFNKVPEAKDVIRYETKLITEFENRARPHINGISSPPGSSNYWEWLARAQHHYLPTRLLDWTERAATALYFSVQNKFDNSACVWAILAPDELDTRKHSDASSVDTVKLYRPPHIVPRITMQQGCFTVHPSDYIKWPRIWIHGPRVIYVINKNARREILVGLNAVGVNEASLYPDLDGIARYLKRTIKPT